MKNSVKALALFATIGAGVLIVPQAGASKPSSSMSAPGEAHNDSKPKAVHWSYEGPEGPEHWGDIDPQFSTCKTGRLQSPIDLRKTDARKTKSDITLAYKSTTVELVNNGHTVQATVPAGSEILIDGTPYSLKQFHFHLPSEHTVDGGGTAMELHFVHMNAQGKLAVLGVLMEEKPDASPFGAIWEKLPEEEGQKAELTQPVDLNRLLPAKGGHYRYSGSLTTPPCSEGVLWTVLKNPVHVAPDEAAKYRELFPKSNRPVQPLNDRELSVSKD